VVTTPTIPTTFGKYRALRVIALTASGAMLEAEHAWTGRRVALKWLRGGDPDANARFVRTTRVAGRVAHENVVAVLDADTGPDGSIYVVQEYLEGETLAQLLSRVPSLGVERTRAVLSPVMEALSSAHRAGIVHRDVRPANIFLSQTSAGLVPKLCDFGLSKLDRADHDITDPDLTLGAPSFMSPEQFVDPTTVDQRADVWAMAVTWYACLSGRLPYEGATALEVGASLTQTRGTPLASVSASLPPALLAAIDRGLARSLEERWQTMQELSEAIDGAFTQSSRPRAAPRGRGAPGSLAEVPPRREARRPQQPPRSDRPVSRDDGLAALVASGLGVVRFGAVPTAPGFREPVVGAVLTRVLRLPTVVIRFSHYEDLHEALRAGRLEAAWMAPAPFAHASAAALVKGVVVAVRAGRSDYVSVLLGHVDRAPELLRRSLLGRRAAWVDRWSAAGYLMPRAMLRGGGVDPDAFLGEQALVGSYESATESLLRGVADIAGVFGRHLEDGTVWHHGMEHRELRTLAVSRPIPSDVLALSAGVSPALATVLASRLEALALAQEESRGLLELLGAERLAPFDPSKYGWMEEIVREDRTAAAIAARVRREDLG